MLVSRQTKTGFVRHKTCYSVIRISKKPAMSSFSIGSTNRTEIKNEADLAEVTPGSLLQIHRGSYTHWGVYIGDGKVCHLTVEVFKENGSSTASLAALSSSKGSVRIQYYTDMLCGENLKVYVNNSNDAKWK
ncbi:hypothetical protein RRG08_009093 [Elysia crispata]|uniref:LRAT domain-containing protein n=1 Tax=Elysia crispata TaxID=231223 RepID=A0AAE0Y892_9GAST|nr:hypothetical protein RRG08_009093 [Elysia crispata]